MNNLKDLSINPEKVMKNNELVNLRGGEYDVRNCLCFTPDKEGNKINTSEVTCCSQKVRECCSTDYMNCY